MEGKLSNKVALITGGSRGIGHAIAMQFAREGADVIVTARTKADLDQTVDELQKEGARALAVDIDLGKQGSVERLVQIIYGSFPLVNILVNNAGIGSGQSPKPIFEYDDDFWERSIFLNLTVPYPLTKPFVPRMIDQKWGRIINISSSAGKKAFYYASAYCASKHGVIGLTRACALDLAKSGLTVNAICPGPVRTGMLERRLKMEAEEQATTVEALEESRTPMGRILEPEEVARLAVFLASEESSGMTGEAINVSGGSTMY